MNWISHLDMVAKIIVSAEVASVSVNAVFFSDRVRGWISRKRWGSVPSAAARLDSIARAGMDDLSAAPIRPQAIAVLRNPFDPRAREALGESPLAQRHQDEVRRPAFRRSTVLQQRIAEYERALAVLALSSPELGERARSAFLPGENALLKPRFEGFRLPSFHQAQLS